MNADATAGVTPVHGVDDGQRRNITGQEHRQNYHVGLCYQYILHVACGEVNTADCDWFSVQCGDTSSSVRYYPVSKRTKNFRVAEGSNTQSPNNSNVDEHKRIEQVISEEINR